MLTQNKLFTTLEWPFIIPCPLFYPSFLCFVVTEAMTEIVLNSARHPKQQITFPFLLFCWFIFLSPFPVSWSAEEQKSQIYKLHLNYQSVFFFMLKGKKKLKNFHPGWIRFAENKRVGRTHPGTETFPIVYQFNEMSSAKPSLLASEYSFAIRGNKTLRQPGLTTSLPNPI